MQPSHNHFELDLRPTIRQLRKLNRRFIIWYILSFLIGSSVPLMATRNDQDDLRLGKNVIPNFEHITLTIDPHRDTYSGSVTIELDISDTIHAFRFHAEGISLERITLSNGTSRIKLESRPLEVGLVEVSSSKRITPGHYQLAIDFKNSYNTQSVGLYKVQTAESSYTFTQFEAWYARKAFPCWDEPEFKIPYQLTVHVPRNEVAVSNTPIERQTAHGSQKTIIFKKTPPLPSYLIALAVGPFDTISIPGLSIPGRIVSVKGMASKAHVAASVAAPILKALEAFFEMRYPFEKLDLIAVPEYHFGAMENPGAITFIDNILLMDSATAGASDKGTLVSVLAHELSHMWFGDMVTMRWWDDIWLNESFASWLGDKISDQVSPEYKTGVLQARSVLFAMSQDAGLSTHAMRRHVSPRDNADQLFDNLAYLKGEALLRMAEEYVGADMFRRGILKYVNAHRWKNTTASDLMDDIDAISGKGLSTTLSSFLDQPGVPLVNMELTAEGELRLRQERFLLPNQKDSVRRTWRIPLVLRYAIGDSIMQKTILFADDSMRIALDSHRPVRWIVPNVNAAGYYRWSLSPQLLESLARNAKSAMNDRERINFLGNIRPLLTTERLSPVDYLGALRQFEHDYQPQVSERFIAGIIGLWYTYFEGVDSLQDVFVTFADSILRPTVHHYGLEKKPGEDETISFFRPMYLSFLDDILKDTAVWRFADSLTRMYLHGSIALEPALAQTVLSISARHGDSLLFATYMDKFLHASTLDRPLYLEAMGHFQQGSIIDELLKFVLHGPLRPQEFLSLPFTIQQASPRYRDRIFEWSIANYDSLRSKVTRDQVASLLYFASNVSSQNFEAALKFYSSKEHDAPGTADNLASMTENYNFIRETRRAQLPRLAAYLKKWVLK